MTQYVHQEVTEMLHLLDSSTDINVELKTVTLLAACLATNNRHFETIVSYNPIYDKLEMILSRGLSLRSTIVLNFLTSLVYSGERNDSVPSQRQLVIHAKNMVRGSGCLRILAASFCSDMMFPDTWKALCQCLTQCCDDSKLNKDYCSYLVPVCIKKLQQGSHEVIPVLHAILQEHAKNIDMFIKSNGLLMMTRENLQNVSTLQVLSAVVQKSSEAAIAVQNSNILAHLSNILQRCGSNSLKGQWCTVIMFYVNKITGDNTARTEQDNKTPTRTRIDNEMVGANLLSSSFRNMTKCFSVTKEQSDHVDTQELFRNVWKEILMSKDNVKEITTKNNFKINGFVANKTDSISQRHSSGHTRDNLFKKKYEQHKGTNNSCNKIKIRDEDEPNNLSFSFLIENFDLSSVRSRKQITREPAIKNANEDKKTSENNLQKQQSYTEKCCQTSPNVTMSKIDTIDTLTSVNNFIPDCTSTPKKQESNVSIARVSNKIRRQMSLNIPKQKKDIPCARVNQRANSTQKRIVLKPLKKCPVTKIANRSISLKIFDAVNESCTTVVNTVKSIFMPWKQRGEHSASTAFADTRCSSHVPKEHSKLSFTDYMKRRDAILGNIKAYPKNCKESSHCTTCDDTILLKEKLANDDNLKETIKKLKIGINLYGCDFKKIAKKMWSQEVYMTPAVLFTLYRKLIKK